MAQAVQLSERCCRVQGAIRMHGAGGVGLRWPHVTAEEALRSSDGLLACYCNAVHVL